MAEQEYKAPVDTSNYSPERLKAYHLMEETGVVNLTGRRLGNNSQGAHCLDDVAEENLGPIIEDLRNIKKDFDFRKKVIDHNQTK